MEPLDNLPSSVAPASPAVTESTGSTVQRIAKMNPTHDAMVDFLLANPGIPQHKIASHFGYTQAWVSSLMASDAFKNALRARKVELIDPTLVATMEERFRELTERSVEKLMELIHTNPNLDPEILIKAATLGAKSLGLGQKESTHTIVLPEQDRLAILAERLTKLQSQKRNEGVIDVQVTEIQS